jgi:hypothetical protein
VACKSCSLLVRFCACGCGGKLKVFTVGLERKFLFGHHMRALLSSAIVCEICDKKFLPKHRQSRCNDCLDARPFCACGCGRRLRPLREHNRKPDGKYASRECRNRDPKQRTLERRRTISRTLREGYASGRIDLPKPYVGRHCGWLTTRKGGRLFYKSSPEKAFTKDLDVDEAVTRFENEPFRLPYFLNGVRHTYYPDFLVELSSGEKLLIELKPLWVFGHRESKKKTVAKMEAAAKYCDERGLEFALLTNYKRAA